MNWVELTRLTALVRELPLAERLSRQQLNQVLVAAHSTMIEGSQLTSRPSLSFYLVSRRWPVSDFPGKWGRSFLFRVDRKK